jgi:hypothetical protein
MGCWNETCGITQMPICAGDKVRMFLIVSNDYEGYDDCHSYTTDLWRPFGLPLKGTYDEYGGIENLEEDALSDLLLASLKEILVEVPNRMGEVFKREELDWQTALNFLTDEGLRVTDPHHVSFITKRLDELLAKLKEQVPDLPDNGWSSERSALAKDQKAIVKDDPAVVRVYHMMVHEDVYQALTREYKAPSSRFSAWTEGDMRKELEVGAQQYIKQVREEHEATKGLSELDKVERSFMRMSRRWETHNRFVAATNHLTGNYGSGQYLRKYLDFVEKRIAEGAADDDADIKNLTDQFIDFVCFNMCMTLLRKMWAPQCGKGGQDREYTIHKFLGETIAEFSEKKMKEWDEEMAQYDDDIDEESSEEDAVEEDAKEDE